jgi:hypothetical protein
MHRRRLRFVLLAVATIGVGLFVHLRAPNLPPSVRDVLGDALWAAMMTWWLGAAAPRARLGVRSVVAYGVCVAVEVSQLYHAPALDAIRATRLGHLVLGDGFDARDLVSYAGGVAAAVLIEALLDRRAERTAQSIRP